MKRIFRILLILSLLGVSTAFADTAHLHLKFDVQGVNDVMRANVIARLKLEHRELAEHFTAPEVERFAAQSVKAVQEAVMPYGYYHAEVGTRVTGDATGWKIQYSIRLGQPVLVKSVDVKVIGAGSDNAKIKRVVNGFPLKPGNIFNSVIYSDARDKLFDVINNQGYIKAVARESKVLVNTDKNTADIILYLQTNERYYFGKLNFNKNAYSDDFMRRFDHFHEDEPFSSNKILQYQQQMNGSRYFKQVVVVPDFDNTVDNRVPLQASVVPINARRYAFGIGYGTFTGPRFIASTNFKRLTDSGQSLDAQLKLSSILSGVALKYFIPGKDPLTEQWVIGANYQKFQPKNGKSYSRSVSFGYTKKLHHWTLISNLNYLRENYKVENQPSRGSQLLYPSLNAAYVKTDNVVQPTYGRSLELSLQGASNNVFSSTSFLQGDVKGKLFMTPFSFGHVILRGELGYTLVHDLTDLPLSMRYFAGGMTTVRGYPDSSIGPGKYLTVASVEYRQHIAYDFSGAAFYDIGTASDHFNTPLYRGAGVGVVYESVIGPIKLYAARGLSKQGHPWQIEFSMGPEF